MISNEALPTSFLIVRRRACEYVNGKLKFAVYRKLQSYTNYIMHDEKNSMDDE